MAKPRYINNPTELHNTAMALKNGTAKVLEIVAGKWKNLPCYHIDFGHCKVMVYCYEMPEWIKYPLTK